MLHDTQQGSRDQGPAQSGDSGESAADCDPIRIAIPALDDDERAMLREIAKKIRRIETRNTEVERTFEEIAAAVENTADEASPDEATWVDGPEGQPTGEAPD